MNSPGGRRRPDRTGSPVLSQCLAGGGRTGEHGPPHHHLTTQWRLRTWLCHFPAGRRSLHGRLRLLLAKEEPRVLQSGGTASALQWWFPSGLGRGRYRSCPAGSEGRWWAAGSQRRPG